MGETLQKNFTMEVHVHVFNSCFAKKKEKKLVHHTQFVNDARTF